MTPKARPDSEGLHHAAPDTLLGVVLRRDLACTRWQVLEKDSQRSRLYALIAQGGPQRKKRSRTRKGRDAIQDLRVVITF